MTNTLATPKITERNLNSGRAMNSSELIDKLGGTTAVARLLNVKPPSVHAWRSGAIPEDKLIRLSLFLERAGITTRKELFPNDWAAIWPELEPAANGRRRDDQPPASAADCHREI